MPSIYPYRKTIRNEYLGLSKVIRAMNALELQWLVEAQIEKWDDQEARKRQQKQKEAEREENRRQAVNSKWQVGCHYKSLCCIGLWPIMAGRL